jgi:multidrug transporter EmrE-like cation transporter
MTSPLIYGLLILDILFTVSAQLMLRLGARRLADEGFSFSIIFEPLKNGFLFLGIVLYGISFFLYILVLSRLQLNIVYPVAIGVSLVLITLLSYVFLKEAISVLHMLGIAAILFGVILILLPK